MDFLRLQNKYLAKKAKIYTYLLKNQFGSMGEGCLIKPTLKSSNLKYIFLGDKCRIDTGCWISCVKTYFNKYEYNPELKIGDNTIIGRYCHIIACDHMEIGANVAIAERVYITDNIHGYEDVNTPIMEQPLKHAGPVKICDGVWIGDGASILPNVTIGEHSVVGCNSVVTKSIPPFSVAAGIPAKIIKKYNPETKNWERPD